MWAYVQRIPAFTWYLLALNLFLLSHAGSGPAFLDRAFYGSTLPSGQMWAFTFGELWLIIGLLVLYGRFWRLSRRRDEVSDDDREDPRVAYALFFAFLAEGALIPQVANSIFFIIAFLPLADVNYPFYQRLELIHLFPRVRSEKYLSKFFTTPLLGIYWTFYAVVSVMALYVWEGGVRTTLLAVPLISEMVVRVSLSDLLMVGGLAVCFFQLLFLLLPQRLSRFYYGGCGFSIVLYGLSFLLIAALPARDMMLLGAMTLLSLIAAIPGPFGIYQRLEDAPRETEALVEETSSG